MVPRLASRAAWLALAGLRRLRRLSVEVAACAPGVAFHASDLLAALQPLQSLSSLVVRGHGNVGDRWVGAKRRLAKKHLPWGRLVVAPRRCCLWCRVEGGIPQHAHIPWPCQPAHRELKMAAKLMGLRELDFGLPQWPAQLAPAAAPGLLVGHTAVHCLLPPSLVQRVLVSRR
jgi:hypothetical protein